LFGKKLKVAPANGILQRHPHPHLYPHQHPHLHFTGWQRDPLPGGAFVSSVRERVESLLVFGIALCRGKEGKIYLHIFSFFFLS